MLTLELKFLSFPAATERGLKKCSPPRSSSASCW